MAGLAAAGERGQSQHFPLLRTRRSKNPAKQAKSSGPGPLGRACWGITLSRRDATSSLPDTPAQRNALRRASETWRVPTPTATVTGAVNTADPNPRPNTPSGSGTSLSMLQRLQGQDTG